MFRAPNEMMISRNTAKALATQGEHEKAIQMYREIIKDLETKFPNESQDFQAVLELDIAKDYVSQKKFDRAIEYYNKAIKGGFLSGQLLVHCEYSMASAYSCLKKTEQAIEYLDKAITDGFKDYTQMEKDTDLDNIRDDTCYKKLLEKLKGKNEKGPAGGQEEGGEGEGGE
jgi:tetratricopeptide (TPR) repeat protein